MPLIPLGIQLSAWKDINLPNDKKKDLVIQAGMSADRFRVIKTPNMNHKDRNGHIIKTKKQELSSPVRENLDRVKEREKMGDGVQTTSDISFDVASVSEKGRQKSGSSGKKKKAVRKPASAKQTIKRLSTARSRQSSSRRASGKKSK